MPADIITKPDPQAGPQKFSAAPVETNATLDLGNWQTNESLFCESLTLRVNGFDRARLTYEAGDIIRAPGQTGDLNIVAPIDLTGQFVRIPLPEVDAYWVGYLIANATQRQSAKGLSYTAYGLEYFLDRQQVDRTYVEDTQIVNPPNPPVDIVMGRTVPFNESTSKQYSVDASQRGNMSTQAGEKGPRVFAGSPDEAEEWTAYDILAYLVEYFQPRSKDGTPSPCPFVIGGGENNLVGYKPAFDPALQTPFEILNMLANPRRGLCWHVEYNDAVAPKGELRIIFDSLATAQIDLPSGGNVPANIFQRTLDFDDDYTLTQHNITQTRTGEYKQVRVRGARITSTFSLSLEQGATADGQLKEDWQSGVGLEQEYRDAAKDEPDYPVSQGEQAERNDAFRRAEKYYRVFSAFRIPPDWTGIGINGQKVFPGFLHYENAAAAELPRVANYLELTQKTLLARDADYTSVANILRVAPAESLQDMLMPMLLVQTNNEAGSFQYAFADKLSGNEYYCTVGDTSRRVKHSYNISLQQDAPGLLLRSTGMQHTIAGTQMNGAEPTNEDPEIGYDTAFATLTAYADWHCEDRYPDDIIGGDATQAELLTIDLGPAYRLDYLTPETYIGLRDGKLQQTTGGIIRDDRPFCKDVARLAWEWYQQPVQQLSATWAQWLDQFFLGMLITQLSPDAAIPTDVNSVVGAITYDYSRGTTSIETLGDTFDVRRVI